MKRLAQQLFKPIDISSLVFFRIAFGFIMLWEVMRYLKHDWVERYFIDPDFYFTYPGFHWVAPFEGNNMYVVFLVLGILAFCIMLGLFYRVGSILFFIGFTYIFLLDKSNYLNHFYLISLLSLIMIFLPANRALSLDVKIWPDQRLDYVPLWTTGMLVFMIGIAYFFGGVAKLNPDWLRGQPMALWMGKNEAFPIIGPFFKEDWMVLFFSYSGLLLDLLIVPALLWKPTRTIAYIAICMFHVMNHFLWQIGIFPWFMIAATTIFFKPDWFRNLLSSISFLPLKFPPKSKKPKSDFPYSKVVVYSIVIWASIQILLPLRHWLFKGNVSWNEKGHRFAWHMKLRDKTARAKFTVKDISSTQKWEIDNTEYLSKRQRRKMRTRPDMILQYAHHLENIFKINGYPDVEVYADIKAKLNGRDYQTLIKPDVDLTKIDSGTDVDEYVIRLTQPFKR